MRTLTAVGNMLRDVVWLTIVQPVWEGRPRSDILAFTMPGFATSDYTKTNATRLAESLGVTFATLDITGTARTMLAALARLRAHLRQAASSPDTPAVAAPTPKGARILDFGSLQIDHMNRTVRLCGETIALSTGDFDLLWELASHAGEVLTREDLLYKLRGVHYDGLDRSVDVAISRLRKKLDDDTADPKKIKTIRHKGYLFANDVWH